MTSGGGVDAGVRRRQARTDQAPTTAPAAAPWRGVHHLALVTPDLDATLRFYHDVLGLAVASVAPATALHGRHAVLVGDGGGGRLLHFLEQPDAAIHPYPPAA